MSEPRNSPDHPDDPRTDAPQAPAPAESPETSEAAEDSKRSATRTAAPRQRPRRKPPQTKQLPPWKVVLHNDDENEMEYVVLTIVMLTPIKEQEATIRMLEAHIRGKTALLTTHKERAELYQQQFTSCNLTVTIEPA